jgi:chromosome segregation ATPase
MRAEQRVASEEVIGLQSRVRALQQELANKQRRVEELELATHTRSMRPHHAEVGISTRTASMAAAAGSGDEIARLQAENSMLASQRSELALEVERLRAKLREAAIDLKRLLGDRERLIDLSNELRADLALAEERSRDGLAVPHLEQRVRELEALVRALRRELSRYAAEEDLLATERLASASLIDEAAAAAAVAAHGRGLRRVRSSQYDEDNRRHRGHLRRASMDGSTTLAPPFTPNSSAFAPSTPAALDRSLQRLQEAREHLAVAGAAPPSAGLRPRSLSQSERTTISQTKARIKSSQRGEFVEKRRQARNYNIKEDWE